MNSIIWKGVSSTTIKGLIINELPPISKPEMRVTETVIDGRNGSIIENLGYNAYDKPITISLYRDYDIDEIIKYFTGEGEVVFSNEPDKVYRAKIHAQIDYNRLLRYRQAVVLFRTQPFKYAFNEEKSATEMSVASGSSIIVSDIVTKHLARFSVYGKSTQNGIPTLDDPVEIVSLCEDGSISVTVNDETVDLSIGNGLRAIPITDESLATYTDPEGKMWCADEIDFEQGVYIQRIGKWIVDGTKPPSTFVEGMKGGRVCGYKYTEVMSEISTERMPKLCDRLKPPTNTHPVSYKECEEGFWYFNTGYADTPDIFLIFNLGPFDTVEEVQAYLVEHPLTFIGVLAKPKVTPLTEEQISICEVLKTNSPTTISNDENAYMSVGYLDPFEVENKGFETSRPKMTITGNGTVEIVLNGVGILTYTFPEGENQVVIDSEKEDAYLGSVLKNRNMNGEFPVLQPGTNKIEWSGDVDSIEIEPRSRWL